MKKGIVLLLIGVSLLSTTACGKNTQNNSSTEKNVEESIDNAEVILCEYKNLPVEKVVYTVTDEDIDEQINSMLEEYVSYKKTDSSIAEGAYVDLEIYAKDGNDVVYDYRGEDQYNQYYAGSGEFGDKFDSELMGKKTGDSFNIDITYDEDYWDDSLIGCTINYDVKIGKVYIEECPELTEEFIVESLGYDSIKSLREDIGQKLKEQNEETSIYNMRMNLVQLVVDGSEFNGYSMEGMEEDALNDVHIMMVCEAIIEKEKLQLSDSEYETRVEEYVLEMDYDTKDELLEEYTEDTVRFWIYQDIVGEFLEKYADITEVEAVEEIQEFDID